MGGFVGGDGGAKAVDVDSPIVAASPQPLPSRESRIRLERSIPCEHSIRRNGSDYGNGGGGRFGRWILRS